MKSQPPNIKEEYRNSKAKRSNRSKIIKNKDTKKPRKLNFEINNTNTNNNIQSDNDLNSSSDENDIESFQNYCVECGVYLGVKNPRQLCGKVICIFKT